MLNLFKMDLRRSFRGKLFYCLILGLGVMLGTFALTGTLGDTNSIASLIGPVSSGNDMMASMGISMVMIFGAIFVTALIGSDFATGFIKNIFTVHAKKTDYVISKLLVSAIGSAVMLAFYVILMAVLGAVQGLPFGDVGMGGILCFILEKLMLCIALNAMVIMVNVFCRNRVVGILVCFVLGMGGITMLLSLAGNALSLPILTTISTLTVAGSAGMCTLIPNTSVLLHVVIASAAWCVIGILGSLVILKKKDLKA